MIQVRSKQGGGTRKVIMHKTATKKEILSKAEELFFPEGCSSFGLISKYDNDVFDFRQNILSDNISIEEIYKKTGLTMIRFYLSSRLKSKAQTSTKSESLENAYKTVNQDDEDENAYKTVNRDDEDENAYKTVNRDDGDENAYKTVNRDDEDENAYKRVNPWDYEEYDLYSATNSFKSNNYFSPNHPSQDQPKIDQDDLIVRDYVTTQSALNSSESVGYDIILDSNKTSTNLIIHRGQVVKELIQAFEYLEDDCGKVEVEMILPNGEPERALDTGGVFRDCLAEFWTAFYDLYTEGTVLKVPIITQELSQEKWTAIARIIKVGWTQENYFPIKLNPILLEQCFYKTVLSDIKTIYIQSLPPIDRNIIKQAINHFESVDINELISIFTNLQSKLIPTKDNLLFLIQGLANRDLIQKPCFIRECWAPVLFELVPKQTFSKLRDKMLPTTKNVLESLHSPDATSSFENQTVFGFLQKYIKEADENQLSAFVRFCTGADVLIGKTITVNYVSSCGFNSSPVAHVCVSLLELPNTYISFVQFRSEMNSILKSKVWVMDII